MRHKWFVAALTFVGVLATLLFSAPSTPAHAQSGGDELAQLRAATARYHDLGQAKKHGYGLFTDAKGIACIANPPVGAMGVHYVNGSLLGTLDPLKPQALVYAPGEDGTLHLAAVEYVVFQAGWDAVHPDMAPMLWGQMFMLTPAPNRYGLPAFYSLHVWVWMQNPSGAFAMWNPDVHCGNSAVTPR
jgi:hypothetical protein